MWLDVEILDTESGRTHQHSAEYDEDDGLEQAEQSADFMWGEGNWSCDCNRALFCNMEPVACGHSRFLAKGIVRGTGKILFNEIIASPKLGSCSHEMRQRKEEG